LVAALLSTFSLHAALPIWRMERYEVRLAQHVVDAAPGFRAQLGDDRRRRRVGIVEDHPHPETVVGTLRHGLADTAQPDEAERLAAHTRAQHVGRPPPRPGTVADEPVAFP